MESVTASQVRFDLSRQSVRELNAFLHEWEPAETGESLVVEVANPNGMHSLAVGLDARIRVEILGHAGYFIGGMNALAEIVVHGNVGWSVAENIMSGSVRVKGCASECAGASGHGGVVVIEGDASSRCGISLKGSDIVIGGNVGHMSAFMAQAGRMVICGDAGANLGDSLYEAVIYVRGKIHSLGTDAQEEPMEPADHAIVEKLLTAGGFQYSSREFRRIGSARKLYHWHAGAADHY